MEAELEVESSARQCGVSGLLGLLREAVGGGSAGRAAARGPRLQAALARLGARAPLGLPAPLLGRLAALWLRAPLPPRLWAQLGAGLVPDSALSDLALRPLLRWLQAHASRPDRSTDAAFLLSWFHGLMEHNLLNIEYLDVYYEFFFFLLNDDKFVSIACKFIYTLSKPKDVTRGRVLNLLKISKAHKQAKHNNCLFAVINLFKTYKPECVPENVPAVSVTSVFPKVNKLFAENFQLAQIRCNIRKSLASEERLMWWNPSSTAGKKSTRPLIPNVDYIQIGSSLYSDCINKKKCMEFQSVKDLLLGDLDNSVDVPANILSLLVNDGGLHMIMVFDENLQSRFSHVLYQTLYNNFIEKSETSREEKRMFLRRIITLEKYIVQGIPVVSRFLALYVSNWNGVDFFGEILELLEWITFDSFAELYDCILEHIEMLYLTNNNNYCCSIVNMLKRMYIRLHHDMVSNEKQFFLRRKKTYDDVEILTDLTDFMNDLCDKSLHQVYGSAILRNAYLDAYSTIASLQLKCSNPLWTVAPMSLVYGSLCSPSAFGIDRMLGIIIQSHSLYEKVKEVMGRDKLNQQILLMQYYCSDITNSLCLGESLKFRRHGLMLQAMPEKMFDHIPDPDECDKLLHFKYHVAFAIYTYMQMQTETVDIPGIIPPMFTNIISYAETIFSNQSQSMVA